MHLKLLVALVAVSTVTAQYGPIKKGGPKRTTTPFPPQQPDYNPDINSVGPDSSEEDSGVLSGAYGRPQSPAGAVSRPDNPWLQGIISQNAPAPGPVSRPAGPSYNYGGSAPAPAPAPAPIACGTPGYVCAQKYECQGGVTTSSGTGSTQCNPSSEVCCRQQQPQPAYRPPPPPPPQPQPAYRPPAPQPQPAYQPQPQPQPAYQPQPQPQPAYQPQPQPAYQPQPQPQPAYQPQPQPQPAYQPQPQPQPAYQPQPQPQSRPRPGYPPATPIGGSIYDSQPAPAQPRPVPNYNTNYVTEAPIQRYTGPLNTTPHPGCAAALKCVEEIYCTWDGVMADTPQFLSREQTENKVPLAECQNIETGIIGKCCRDPNYKDPWPAGMMMNSGPFDDGLYHPGHSHATPNSAPAFDDGLYRPAPAAPAPLPLPAPVPQQPAYAPQQPAYAPQPQYTPNVPAYAPQPQPNFNSRPSGTTKNRESCGATATCTPANLCPGDRLTQPGKACRVPNDDSTGVCCTKLQYPTDTNNQQYNPNANRVPISLSPYGNPKPQSNTPKPYNAPSYNQPKPATKPVQAQPAPNPYRPAQQPALPQQSPDPYKPASQPKPQAYNPYKPAQQQPALPQQAPNPYGPAPQPKPASPPQAVNPSYRPAQQPKPVNPQAVNPYGPAPQKPAVPVAYAAPAPQQPQIPYQPPQKQLPPKAPIPQPTQPSYRPPQPTQPAYRPPQPTTARPTTRFVPPVANSVAPVLPEDISNSVDQGPSTRKPALATTAPPPLFRPKGADLENENENPNTPKEVPAAQPKSIEPEPGKDCGVRRNVPRPNGPDGAETGFGEFPWTVQVLNSADQSALCSGAILAENIVITSASCVNGKEPSTMLVKAGDWKIQTENPADEPKPVQIQNVATTVVHPEFNPIPQDNDMAVLVLSEPLTFDSHVDKLCLGKDAPAGQPPAGTNCVITGWGKTAAPGTVMHSIPVNFMPNDRCQEAFKSTALGKHFQLHDSFTCALPKNPNHDLCQVDRGSPIACEKPDGKYELSGIYSWDVGCHPKANTPTVMSKVDKEWVQSVMDTPVEELQSAAASAKRRQEELGQSPDSSDATKPGFSQGYGK